MYVFLKSADLNTETEKKTKTKTKKRLGVFTP